mmetsp:Transcript_86189/g.238950  ORF Transcript_86189/g.238950 Transcript_86189/m.238950 type:complete len:224 (+) Transcript_86189:498-1169(+)
MPYTVPCWSSDTMLLMSAQALTVSTTVTVQEERNAYMYGSQASLDINNVDTAAAEPNENAVQTTLGRNTWRMRGTTFANMRLVAEHTMKNAASRCSPNSKLFLRKYASGPSLTASAKQSVKAANKSRPEVRLVKRDITDGGPVDCCSLGAEFTASIFFGSVKKIRPSTKFSKQTPPIMWHKVGKPSPAKMDPTGGPRNAPAMMSCDCRPNTLGRSSLVVRSVM